MHGLGPLAEVYPYKGTLVNYYRWDTTAPAFNSCRATRLDCGERGGSGSGHSVEHIDPTTVSPIGDDGARASHFRVHRSWPPAADGHGVLVALQRLLFDVIARPSALRWSDDPAAFEAMMTAFRVRRGGTGRFAHGEPSPEGVHQDSAELTAIILVERRNVAPPSGGNRVWSLEQPCGKASAADAASSRLLASLTLLERFDTLLVLDRAVKHEGRPLAPGPDEHAEAVRDVLTFEVRRGRPAPASVAGGAAG